MGKLLKNKKIIVLLLTIVAISTVVFYYSVLQDRIPIEPVQAQTTIPTFSVFELTLQAISPGTNPYVNGPSVTATFTGISGLASGQTYTINGFWDGDSIWKIRFTPTAVGDWSYRTLSTDSGLNNIQGSITAIGSSADGFTIRDPDHIYAFKKSNGNNIFLMGDTCWNCMSLNGNLVNSTWNAFIDIRQNQNFNFIRSYLVAIYGTSNTDAHRNEGGWAFDPWNPDQLNPNYFKEADKRIVYANSKGISMHLLFGSDRANMYNFFGDGEKLERYIRYVTARFASYDVVWEGRVEFEDEAQYRPTTMYQAEIFANKIGNWVKQYDPYNHVQSMHTLDSNKELLDPDNGIGDQGWLDWIMHQGWEGNSLGYDWDNITSDRSTYTMPVINEEFYYENSGAGATHPHHVGADTLRKGAWQVIMAGSSGLAYGNTGTLNARGMFWQGLQYADSLGATYMTYLYNFMTNTQYWQLSPLSATNNNVLVNPGSEYVSYFENGGNRTIDLALGDYKYKWYNPRQGTYGQKFSITGGLQLFSAPDSNDWVLHIQTETSGPEVTNLSPANYQTAYLQEGSEYYIDRTYTITTIPSAYQNLLWIKTANDDKQNNTNSFLTFNVNQAVTVYVAYDQRISPTANWLANWQNEGQSIQTSIDTLNLYSQSFCPGPITLGGNYGIDQSSMYTVLIRQAQSSSYLPLDLDCSQGIDRQDLTFFKSFWQNQDLKADFNQDSFINTQDFGIMLSKWGTY